jgi:hypothetical protein
MNEAENTVPTWVTNIARYSCLYTDSVFNELSHITLKSARGKSYVSHNVSEKLWLLTPLSSTLKGKRGGADGK